MELELTLLWAAVVLYALLAGLAFVGLVWEKEAPLRWVTPGLALGLVVHGAPIVLRWVRIGHGPYLSALEILSIDVWVGVLMLLLLCWRRPHLRAAAGPVLGVGLLLLGWAVLSSPETEPLPAAFRGVWLVVHIVFACCFFGAILVASGLSIQLLVEARRPEPDAGKLDQLDLLASRLVTVGFIAQAFMILAGMIWARNAWGRYWGWDPIETWSLATWVAYGLFLHLRLAYRVKGRTSAWVVVGLLALSCFTLFFVGLLTSTIHTEFMLQ